MQLQIKLKILALTSFSALNSTILQETPSPRSSSVPISQETWKIIKRIDDLFTTFLIFQETPDNIITEKVYTGKDYMNFVVDKDDGNKIDRFDLGWHKTNTTPLCWF